MKDNLVDVQPAASDTTNISSISSMSAVKEIDKILPKTSNSKSATSFAGGNLLFSSLPECCHQTLDTFVAQNDMMVCHQCRRIIKVFRTESNFEMFMIFCKSKKRLVKTYFQDGLWVVSYNASFTS